MRCLFVGRNGRQWRWDFAREELHEVRVGEDVNLETIDGIARNVLLSMCVCVFDVLLLVFQCLCCCMFLFDKALVHRRFLHMMKDLPAVLEIHFVISTIVWMLDGLLRSLVAPELWQPWKPLKLIAVSWLLSVFKRRSTSSACSTF